MGGAGKRWHSRYLVTSHVGIEPNSTVTKRINQEAELFYCDLLNSLFTQHIILFIAVIITPIKYCEHTPVRYKGNRL